MVGHFTVKGYTRKGGVLYGLKRFTDALKTYEEALKLDPNNKVTESFKYKTKYEREIFMGEYNGKPKMSDC